VAQIAEQDWKTLKEKLKADGRLEKYALGEPEQEYVTSRGMEILRLHATDFVNKRLAPANPKNVPSSLRVRGSEPIPGPRAGTGVGRRTSSRAAL